MLQLFYMAKKVIIILFLIQMHQVTKCLQLQVNCNFMVRKLTTPGLNLLKLLLKMPLQLMSSVQLIGTSVIKLLLLQLIQDKLKIKLLQLPTLMEIL